MKLEDASKSQCDTLHWLEEHLSSKSEYLPSDDSYKFVKPPIYAYVKLISPRARNNPPGSVKVIVRSAEWNLGEQELSKGNDWYGFESRHMFITRHGARDRQEALSLLERARLHS
jgi:hypothetical protein